MKTLSIIFAIILIIVKTLCWGFDEASAEVKAGAEARLILIEEVTK